MQLILVSLVVVYNIFNKVCLFLECRCIKEFLCSDRHLFRTCCCILLYLQRYYNIYCDMYTTRSISSPFTSHNRYNIIVFYCQTNCNRWFKSSLLTEKFTEISLQMFPRKHFIGRNWFSSEPPTRLNLYNSHIYLRYRII